MSSATNKLAEEIDRNLVQSSKWFKNWKMIVIGAVLLIGILLAGIYYVQDTRFNANIKINNIKVGGLTANQALTKLESSVLKNEVFIGQERVFDEKDTKTKFTKTDLSSIKHLLRNQWTFFPTTHMKNYLLTPSEGDQYRSQTMKKLLEEKLVFLNKSLTPPRDAEASLVNGQIIISKSIKGNQYDVAQLINDYQKQLYDSKIYLKAKYIQPIKEDNPKVIKEEKLLQDLVQRNVDYTVQNKVYSLKASNLIKYVTLSKNMEFIIDPVDIKNEITEINSFQSTLNKNFLFKTRTGSVISVKGQSFGWAIDIGKETDRIKAAFVKGDKSVLADNIYGVGWTTNGTGYHLTTNNGIGDTYAEVSIEEQRIWIYKNGKLQVTSPVVTGRHDVHEDTPTGVWYIMYKQSPSILVGSEVGNPHYSVKVSFWAPFTNSGCGFHDASWRKNWAVTAYLTQGSGGCVNTPPNIMKSVYDNLTQYEPVVIY
ncbi:MAG: L,D-transpeptidase family protein [Bacillota bacterium]|nr:L,D-transpeptidase family protein [Bacillota bacterium]